MRDMEINGLVRVRDRVLLRLGWKDEMDEEDGDKWRRMEMDEEYGDG